MRENFENYASPSKWLTVWRQISDEITGFDTRQFKFLSTTHCNDDFSRKYKDDYTKFSLIRTRPHLLAPSAAK
jgi:hypothetical protein